MTTNHDLSAAIAALRAERDANASIGHEPISWFLVDAALDALDAAQGEAVAWGMLHYSNGKVIDCISPEEHAKYEGAYTVPLYAAPPAAVPAGYVVDPNLCTDDEHLAAEEAHARGWNACRAAMLAANTQAPPAAEENVAADAYGHACERMEEWQRKRAREGKEVGTERSLCDGIEWLHRRIEQLEHAPPAAVQAWILRTGHGIGIHVGERPPVDCVGWKPLTAGDIKDAPPAAVAANVRERWNIERDGDALRVCFNNHEKGEACEYVRYVPDAPPAAVPALVEEGLAYFERVGDAGDRKYVEAIRAHIAMLAAERKGE